MGTENRKRMDKIGFIKLLLHKTFGKFILLLENGSQLSSPIIVMKNQAHKYVAHKIIGFKSNLIFWVKKHKFYVTVASLHGVTMTPW